MLLLSVAFLFLIGIILMSTNGSSISGGAAALYPKSLPDSKKQLWDRKELQVNQLLQDIYRDQADAFNRLNRLPLKQYK